MSITFFSAVAFLGAVLIVAEFVWLREEAEVRARELIEDDENLRQVPSPHTGGFAPRRAATSSAAGPEASS